MPADISPREARYGTCYAVFEEDSLTVGNAQFERHWRIENGLLYPTSLFDKVAQREWLARPARLPAPYPEAPLPEESRTVSFRTAQGAAGPTEEPSLRIELEAAGASATLLYRFKLFAQVRGVMMSLEAQGLRTARTAHEDAGALNVSQAPTGLELDEPPAADPLPFLNSLERFAAAPTHLRLTHVDLRDQTDAHNELVFENEWLLHPNERHIRLAGNLFVVENTLTGAGLAFLKHAPLPHARPHRTEADLCVAGRPAGFVYGDSATFGPGHPGYPLAFHFGFYGHGAGRHACPGYPFVLLAYTGGRLGLTETLQKYQRQFRRYEPGRDGLLMTNTWGDRSRDTRICEDFITEEIDAAARLGADVVQIDEGWERGVTRVSARPGGVWQGYWAQDPRFWEPDPERLPHGLRPLVEQCESSGIKLGLWFAPDSAEDFVNWDKDAEVLLALHRQHGISHFKLDSVKLAGKEAERNLGRFFDTVLGESAGRIVLDLDVTAEIRPGYFSRMDTGPLFIENRYTDWRRYWPHQTLRNLWRLSHFVDPLRLRVEFLNSARNVELYGNDPLSPARYDPTYLFAVTMFANPLGWFENSGLPGPFIEGIAPLIKVWKAHRAAIFSGCILPIGATPDGTSWTGFVSVTPDRQEGYLLLFREWNDDSTWLSPLPVFSAESHPIRLLSGQGAATLEQGILRAEIPEKLAFIFARVEARSRPER